MMGMWYKDWGCFCEGRSKMKKCLLVLGLVFFLCSLTYAQGFTSLVDKKAGELADEAEKAYKAGDKIKAVEKLKEAVLLIWNEIPLTVKNIRLVTDYKSYASRHNNIYRAGEPINITCQLLGYKLKKIGEAFSINIITDFYVIDKENKILAGKQSFGKFGLVTPLPTTDFRLDLDYTLTGAPNGIYNIKTVIHDQNTGERTEFTKKIEIR